uniref:Secreted protein n=1 Tax=Setaria viridis TaxID=4556 RepID=A0A4U6TXR8_SETVI|nr:hypothetical protein SEVIR_7G288150v2 [Setaria viridis]
MAYRMMRVKFLVDLVMCTVRATPYIKICTQEPYRTRWFMSWRYEKNPQSTAASIECCNT